MEIQLTKGTKERFLLALKKEVPSAGWLLGWHVETGIICVGCIATNGSTPFHLIKDIDRRTQLLPSGLDLVGVFMCSHESRDTIGIEEYLDQLLVAGYKNLDETSEFCFVMQGTDSCNGYLYSSSLRRAERVKIKLIDRDVLNNDCTLFRIRGNLQLSYEVRNDKGENDADGLIVTMDNLINQVTSSVTAFHLVNSQVLLCNNSEFVSSVDGLRDDSPCEDLRNFITVEDDGFGNVKEKRRKGVTEEKEPLQLKLLFKMTGNDAIERTLSCLPIIHYEKRAFQSVQMSLPIDTIVIMRKNHPLTKLTQVLVEGVCNQLNIMKQCLLEFRKGNVISRLDVFHFKPFFCDHFVTTVYPRNVSDSDLEAKRRQFHQWLLLPEDRPLLRRSNCHIFPDDLLTQDVYLTNTHIGLPPSGVENGETSIVMGTYTYHHYRQDHFDDNGWGCAYRSLQTIVSWFRHQGYTNQKTPTHTEIQTALVDVGDKTEAFIGSRNWIGSLEVSYALQQLIGVTSRIISVNSGSELLNKGRDLATHFKLNGTPVMIGGGVLAHTILGVDFNEKTGDLKFLILDPHYTGIEDLNIIQNKGWCNWRGPEFWDGNSYYNLCLPQRPIDI